MVKALHAKKRRGGSDKNRLEGGDLLEDRSPGKARSHGVRRRLVNGQGEPRVESLNVRSEECGHERKDSLSQQEVGEDVDVDVSREDHRDLPTWKAERSPWVLRKLDGCPSPHGLCFVSTSLPSLPSSANVPENFDFWVTANIMALLNPTLGCRNAERIGSQLSGPNLTQTASNLTFPSQGGWPGISSFAVNR